MNNCCLNFLFLCSLSGIFVFIILGIFTLTNSPFMIIENIKKDDNGEFWFDEITKKKAYLQYFIAALFECLFALLIYILDILFSNKKNNSGQILEIQNLQLNNKGENKIINSVGSQEEFKNNNQNNDNINNINNEINTNIGMSEKDY